MTTSHSENPAPSTPEAPDVISASDGLAADPPQQQEDAGATHPPSEVPASDPKTEELLDAGRAEATHGTAALKKWLSTQEVALVKSHLDSLCEMAKFADGRG